MELERKLATILSADVAEYSRLMAEDENGTLRTFRAHRQVFDSLVASRRGRNGEISMNRVIVAIAALAALFPWFVNDTWSKPIKSMADGPKGSVQFETLTLTADEFWNGAKTGRVTQISGELYPPKGDARVPAIIMSHGGAGISGDVDTWARELRSRGVLVFVVDSYTGRGIKQFPPETTLSRAGQVYDVYQALALLATHPRVDPARIALMGPSRGGNLTILAAMTRSLKAQLPEGVDFAAYLPIYPPISPTFDYGSLARKPIRIFTGSADEVARIADIRAFAEQQRAAGADINIFEYEGAHHAFDNPDARTPFIFRTPTGTSFTVLYHPGAHAKAKDDMKATLREIFGPM